MKRLAKHVKTVDKKTVNFSKKTCEKRLKTGLKKTGETRKKQWTNRLSHGVFKRRFLAELVVFLLAEKMLLAVEKVTATYESNGAYLVNATDETNLFQI